MAVRRKQVQDLAEAMLERFKPKLKHGRVICLDKIARDFGIEIIFDEVDDDLSGFLFRDKKNGRIVIGVNKSHHPNRQRFTIAHELGHFLLHEGETVHFDGQRGAFTVNLRNSESAKGESDWEREANLFAAEVLMPAKFLAQDLRGKDLDLLGEDDFLGKLAAKYEVSIQALTFRLANLGYIEL